MAEPVLMSYRGACTTTLGPGVQVRVTVVGRKTFADPVPAADRTKMLAKWAVDAATSPLAGFLPELVTAWWDLSGREMGSRVVYREAP